METHTPNPKSYTVHPAPHQDKSRTVPPRP